MVIYDERTNSAVYKRRKLDAIKSITVHRIKDRKDYFRWAGDLAYAFADTSKYAAGSYTGGKMPYHFFIDQWGNVHQMLSLDCIGPGARGINKQSVHIAVSGDFRKEHPTTAQLHSLKLLCVKLQLVLGVKEVRGHTEKGFSGRMQAAVGKQCPGQHLNMDALRTQITLALVLKRANDAQGLHLYAH